VGARGFDLAAEGGELELSRGRRGQRHTNFFSTSSFFLEIDSFFLGAEIEIDSQH
jgi:hypothetical protein